MCNAWNHPVSCTCGFGGEGHSGSRGPDRPSGTRLFWGIPPITQTYESYTIPNACCPVCGALVFFHQSSNGGRVFFDRLGHPWPKHACTNDRSVPKAIPDALIPARQTGNLKQHEWQPAGWKPFFISSITRVDQFILQVRGLFGEEQLCLFLTKRINSLDTPSELMNDSLAYARKESEGRYILSVTTSTLSGHITISAHTDLFTARRYRHVTKRERN
jgi:hypothetical protein